MNSGSSQNGASAQSTAPVSAAAAVNTGGFIQADPATNALIITAPEPLYRQLRAVIDQLGLAPRAGLHRIDDRQGRRQQDARHRRAVAGHHRQERRQHAVRRRHATSRTRAPSIVAGQRPSTAAPRTPPSPPQVSQGFNFGVLRKFGSLYTIGALATFFESTGDANILSTPNLVTLDNEEAKIVIGQNVPFITGSYTNTGVGSTTSPFQTIERKDVGLTLRVQAADRRERHRAHGDLPGELQRGLHARAPPAPPPTRARSRPTSWSTTARSWCSAA